jgi:hypothetical protein
LAQQAGLFYTITLLQAELSVLDSAYVLHF